MERELAVLVVGAVVGAVTALGLVGLVALCAGLWRDLQHERASR